MNRFVVAVEGETTMRAAQSLVVHAGVEGVALLAPAQSTHFPTVDSPTGWDLIVGSDKAARAGRRYGLPVAVVDDLQDQPGISLGSPIGLALALAVGVDRVETVALAMPGEPDGDTTVVFPSPIDARSAVHERFGGHDVLVGRGPQPVAAAMALGAGQHRMVLDDHAFMAGITLAAAAVVAMESPPDRPIPAWAQAVGFIRAAAEMGLVVGERTPVANRLHQIR